MSLPENNIKPEQTSKKSGIVMFLLLLVAVLGVAIFVYLKSLNIDLTKVSVKDLIKNNFLTNNAPKTELKLSEFKYDEKEHPVFTVYKDFIIKCTHDSVMGLNKSGEEQWGVTVKASNPLLKVSGQNLLLADIGGRDVYIINGNTVKWSKELETKLFNADISESGYVSVVHEVKGYKAGVSVFNTQGIQRFTRNIVGGFVLSAKISPSAKSVLINSIDASGARTSASLEFTDIFGTPLAGKIPREDVVFPSTWFLSNESAVAVGDSLIICFDKERNEKWKQEFKNRKIFSSNVLMGKYIAVAVSAEGKNGSTNEVIIFNTDGRRVASFALDEDVVNIEAYGDIMAVNTGRKVYFVNAKGKLVGKYSSKIDAVQVNFFNKKEVAVITKGGVVVTEIN